jgi:hypothetical protein
MDRLALVSKILLDSRFLELKRENERLKLRLFWVDHSIDTLKKMMGLANNRRAGPRCRCRICVRTKRYHPNFLDSYDDENGVEACKFGPWFEKLVQQHGLSFASCENDDEHLFCVNDREFYPKPEVNLHFLLIAYDKTPVTTWYSWVYRAKLWHAQTTQDPELLKLTALFKTLDGMYDPDVVDTYESDSDS